MSGYLEAVGGKDIPETVEAMSKAPRKGITSGVISGVKDTFTKDD